MPRPRHLRNAPITEAIIDFRVKARAGLRAEEFGHLKTTLAERFPRMDERRGIETRFEIVEGKGRPTTVKDLGLQGYFFKTADERNIAQFRTDGFTFNRLKPYTSWEDIFPIAMDLWGLYCDVAKPELVTRLALRYINHIPLPPSVKDFSEFLRAAPVIPPELPQYLSRFLTRITIHDPERNLSAHVGQALETDAAARTIKVILDIDAFTQGEFRPHDPTIPETFEQLRHFKNEIFFSSLTEEALRLFE